MRHGQARSAVGRRVARPGLLGTPGLVFLVTAAVVLRGNDGEGSQFFRKQAAKAECMALAVSDAEISERFLSLAKAYRSQADVLKSKKLKTKKKSGKRRR